ncbi:MAG TPA: peptidase, partial [Mycobacterium sp.]|nr:peptidase [Mycobacterium sp.]
MSRRQLLGVVVAACLALSLTACATLVPGTAVSVFSDPFSVAGMPATDGPSGLRPDATDPSRSVRNTDRGEMDHLAVSAVSDIEEFWSAAYGTA